MFRGGVVLRSECNIVMHLISYNSWAGRDDYLYVFTSRIPL